jgi:bile acid:Na+ symporter, BASS family
LASIWITVYRFAHRYLIWLLLGAYLLGALAPEVGIWIRRLDLSQGMLPEGQVSALKVLLAFLLFNAGLGVDLGCLPRRFMQLVKPVAIWAISIVVALFFVLIAGSLLRFTSLSNQLIAEIVTGIALVSAMPVAGSSMAWSQNSDGNLLLGLQLLLVSTLLCPFGAMLVLGGASTVTSVGVVHWNWAIFGSVIPFLLIWVILPSLVGVLIRALVGGERIESIQVWLKMANLVNLLVLNYSNASLCLPKLIRLDEGLSVSLLLLILASAFCIVSLAVAWGVAQMGRSAEVDSRLFRADRIALLLAFSMKNNGVALVLAATTFPESPVILLPIIVYNLLQHLSAATIDRLVLRRDEKAIIVAAGSNCEKSGEKG